MRNCTRDEGGPFGFGNQVLISSHRKLLWSKAGSGTISGVSERLRRKSSTARSPPNVGPPASTTWLRRVAAAGGGA
jgi:hypothetical protein